MAEPLLYKLLRYWIYELEIVVLPNKRLIFLRSLSSAKLYKNIEVLFITLYHSFEISFLFEWSSTGSTNILDNYVLYSCLSSN